MHVSASEKLRTSISIAVQRVAAHGLPVDSIDEALQIQRDNPNVNVALEDIVEQFELQAAKARVTLGVGGIVLNKAGR